MESVNEETKEQRAGQSAKRNAQVSADDDKDGERGEDGVHTTAAGLDNRNQRQLRPQQTISDQQKLRMQNHKRMHHQTENMMQPIEEIQQNKRHKLNSDSVHSETTDSGQLTQLQVDGGASLEAMNVD